VCLYYQKKKKGKWKKECRNKSVKIAKVFLIAPRGSSTLSKIKGKYAKSLCEWVVNRVGWDVGDEFLGGRWLGIGGWRKEVTGGMA